MAHYARLVAVLLALFAAIPSAIGCGGKKEPTPQQKEEQRQKLIKNAERMHREQ